MTNKNTQKMFALLLISIMVLQAVQGFFSLKNQKVFASELSTETIVTTVENTSTATSTSSENNSSETTGTMVEETLGASTTETTPTNESTTTAEITTSTKNTTETTTTIDNTSNNSMVEETTTVTTTISDTTVFVETTTSESTTIAETTTADASLTDETTDETVDALALAPEEIGISITVKDSSGTVIPNATFELRDANTSEVLQTIKTDSAGILELKNLENSSYTLAQISTKTGYFHNRSKIDFTVQESSITVGATNTYTGSGIVLDSVKSTETQKFFNIENDVIPKTELKIIKLDNKGDALEGAIFKLTRAVDVNNTPPQTTDTDGKIIFTNLDVVPNDTDPNSYVRYLLVESESPTGFQPSKSNWIIDVLPDGKIQVATVPTQIDGTSGATNPVDYEAAYSNPYTALKLVDNTLTITNEPYDTPLPVENKGNVLIKKTDSDGNLLPKAEFQLQNKETSEIIKSLYGTDGYIHFYNLAPGTYKLTESVAPIGYEKTLREWEVIVYDSGYTVVRESLASTGSGAKDRNTNLVLDQYSITLKKHDNTLKDGVASDGFTIQPNIDDFFEIRSTFHFNNDKVADPIVAGDTFTIQYDEKLDLNSIYADSSYKPSDLMTESGESIATAIFDPTTNSVKYTFTTVVEDPRFKRDANYTVRVYADIDPKTGGSDGSLITLSNTIGAITQNTSNVRLDYASAGYIQTGRDLSPTDGYSSPENNASGKIISYNPESKMVQMMYYINPKYAIYTRRADFKISSGPSDNLLFDPTFTNIKIYQKITPLALPASYTPDLMDPSKYKDVTSTLFDGEITYEGTSYDIDFFKYTTNYLANQQAYIVLIDTKVNDTSKPIDVQATLITTIYDNYNGTRIADINSVTLNDKLNILYPESDITAQTPTEATLSVVNYKNITLGKLVLDKVDGSREPLEGVEFTLKNLTENTTSPFYTDAKGRISFNNLPAGDYVITETTALAGYQSPTVQWNVKVDDTGLTIVEEVPLGQDPTLSIGNEVYAIGLNRLERLKNFSSYVSTTIPNKMIYQMSTDGMTVLMASEPADLGQLYPKTASDHPVFQYDDSKADGISPSQYNQDSTNVRNVAGDENGYFYYSGVDSTAKDANGTPTTRKIDSAGVNKQAAETNIPGEFTIDLNVTGNAVGLDEGYDIVLVYDNSNSMHNGRAPITREAAATFISKILTEENAAMADPTFRMALVTYASTIQDGTDITYVEGTSTTYRIPDYTVESFITDPNILINHIPSTDYKKNNLGGTFTGLAFDKAADIIQTDGQTDRNKIVIHLTDGLPTYSYGINRSNMTTKLADSYTGTTYGNGTSYFMYNPYWSYYTGSNTYGQYIYNHGLSTESVAKELMETVEMFTVAIEVTGDTYSNGTATKDQAEALMKSMSTDEAHYYDAANVRQVVDMLNDIYEEVPQRTVYKATVTDPMSDNVKFNLGSDGQFDSTDYVLTASDPDLLRNVTVRFENNTIFMDGLTLKNDEWVNLEYRVNLLTENSDFTGDYYYQTNKRTTLKPSINSDTVWDFPVPSVKGDTRDINFSKKWQESMPDNRPDSLTVVLERKLQGELDSSYAQVETAIISRNNEAKTWAEITSVVFENYPRYNNTGQLYEYRIRETSLQTDTYIPIYEEDIDGNVTITNREIPHVLVSNYKGNNAKVQKVDALSNQVLSGVEFELVDAADETKKQKLVSDRDGYIHFSDLLPGTYHLQETKALPGYEKIPETETILIVKVAGEGTITFEDAGKGHFDSSKNTILNKPNHLDITKVDGNNGNKLLAGAIFRITGIEGTDYSREMETGADGLIHFDKLPTGKYQIEEVVAPANYRRIEGVLANVSVDDDGKVTVTNKNSLVSGSGGQLTVNNLELPMYFTLAKVAPQPDELVYPYEPIRTGELIMTLTAPVGETFPDGSTTKDFTFNLAEIDEITGDFSELVIEIDADWISGEYILTEKDAPDGFIKTDNGYKIYVNQEKKTITLTGINPDEEKIFTREQILYELDENGIPKTDSAKVDVVNTRYELPSTGGIGTYLFIFVGVTIMAIPLLFFIKKKRDEKKER